MSFVKDEKNEKRPTQLDEVAQATNSLKPLKENVKNMVNTEPIKLDTKNPQINIAKLNNKLTVENSCNYGFSKEYGLVHDRRYHLVNSNVEVLSSSNTTADLKIMIGKSDFIDAKNSFLTFELTTNHDDEPNSTYGVGSGLNWIKKIQLISKDGQLIDEMDSANKMFVISDRWNKTQQYFNAQGKIKGYDEGKGAVGNVYATPLCDIIPLFKYDKLLPPSLMDKLTIRITMAPAHEVVVDEASTYTDWTVEIKNLKIMLDKYTMDRQIVDFVSKSEIQIEFPAYKHYQKSYNTKNFVMAWEYTVSKALKVIAMTNTVDIQQGNPHLNALFLKDSNRGNIYDLIKHRFRVGSKMTNPIVGELESYVSALRCFDKLSNNNTSLSISPADYQLLYNVNAHDLRRSPNMRSFAGTPVNSGYPLELHLSHVVLARRVCDMFVVYVKRLTIKPVSIEEELMGMNDKISIME